MNETGNVNWDVALCLLLSWLVVFLCLINGIKTSGKVRLYLGYFVTKSPVCLNTICKA